jgi:dTMP kinase
MDLVIDFNLNEYQMLRLLNRFFWVVPRPNVAFLIDLDEEIAFHRKSDTPSVDYLRERREVYLRRNRRFTKNQGEGIGDNYGACKRKEI